MDHSGSLTRFSDKKSSYTYTPATLLIREVFTTVQGEAPFTGRPAVFLRLGGCNRGAKKNSCAGCDTSFEVSLSVSYTIENAVRLVYDELCQLRHPLLVITGGEPGLQIGALSSFLLELHEECMQVGFPLVDVQFETNGDFDMTSLMEIDAYLPKPYFVVSPKEPFTVKHPWFIDDYGNLDERVFIRRVVVDEVTSAYYTLPSWIFLIRETCRNQVYLSGQTVYTSEGIDYAATSRNVNWSVKKALEYGMRVSFQAHAYVGVR